MIDWLELLWQEAQAGTEVSLPEETALRPRRAGRGSGEKQAGAETPEIPAQARGEESRPAPERAGRLARELGAGLPGWGGWEPSLAALYRRVRETASPGLPGTAARGGTVVVREGESAAPGLTEQSLDRSLRRDSRRYDSGMSSY